jgi:hypothetical protein
MKINRYLNLLPMLVITLLALPTNAADRMRAGQWVGTTVIGGRTIPNSSCISKGDADAMNGNAKEVQAYLEKVIPPSICKITDVKADGGQIIYTASCGALPPRVITTSYHGDSSAGTDSIGTKTEAKLMGACK